MQAEQVSSKLGVPILCHAVKKPGRACAQQVVDYVASQHLRSPDAAHPPRLLVVGDRITTDMAFSYRIASLLGRAYPHERDLCIGVLTHELWGREQLGTRVMRMLENTVLRQLVRVGIPPGGTWTARGAPPPVCSAWVRAVAPADAAPLPAPRKARTLMRWLAPLVDASRTIVRETFGSVRRVRELTWSVCTNAPTRSWRSTWRKPQRPPPAPWSRSMSTSARARGALHEKPVPRRVPTADAPRAPRAVPTWLGIPRIRWLMALATLVLLPLGFMGGMKLSELVERWRIGDLSHEGEARVDAPAPPPAPAPEPDVEETQVQLRKKISRCVGLANASLELEHFHLRRERSVLDDKLARLAARPA